MARPPRAPALVPLFSGVSNDGTGCERKATAPCGKWRRPSLKSIGEIESLASASEPAGQSLRRTINTAGGVAERLNATVLKCGQPHAETHSDPPFRICGAVTSYPLWCPLDPTPHNFGEQNVSNWTAATETSQSP